MAASVQTGTLIGLEYAPVTAEVDITNGIPGFVVVGLPDKAVQESRERVKSALKNSGHSFPRNRVTANLAPADVRKEGPLFDVPIALGILAASGGLPLERLTSDTAYFGELALDGELRAVRGLLPLLLGMRSRGLTKAFVPLQNAEEAALVDGLTIFAVPSLGELIRALRGEVTLQPIQAIPRTSTRNTATEDFSEICGQLDAKRALEIAAAGGHNVLFRGPPGAGKSLLARAFPSILPPLSDREALEVMVVKSCAGLLSGSAVPERPFRSPHHTSSPIALVGGGSQPRPGEVTLAHRGVLFLDEFPEFGRQTVENLRQPLEDGFVTICRAAGAVRFPARFQLLAAANPCPCGYVGDDRNKCTCSAATLIAYGKKISGPIKDRIDLHVRVKNLPPKDFRAEANAEPSEKIRERVVAARERQLARYAGLPIFTNHELGHRELRRFCRLDEATELFFQEAAEKLGLTARAMSRVLKVARTIADLAGHDSLNQSHLAEAFQYRETASF